jgi:hypothetical protein
MRASKGSAFEREICKQLSQWWSDDETRDDIFWRSSQSGGRATRRTKQGKTTYGSYGDIAAVDPIGDPLIKAFTIELKRGSSYGSPGDLLDHSGDCTKHPWVKCLQQAIRSHVEAGSRSWLLICKRDRKLPVVYLPTQTYRELEVHPVVPLFRFRFRFFEKDPNFQNRIDICGLTLESFLEKTSPDLVARL